MGNARLRELIVDPVGLLREDGKLRSIAFEKSGALAFLWRTMSLMRGPDALNAM